MMTFRLSCAQPQRHVARVTAATRTQARPSFISHLEIGMLSFLRRCRASSHGHTFADKRPIRSSKNLAESTSTATFALGTNLSRNTGDVRVPARVGAEP